MGTISDLASKNFGLMESVLNQQPSFRVNGGVAQPEKTGSVPFFG